MHLGISVSAVSDTSESRKHRLLQRHHLPTAECRTSLLITSLGDSLSNNAWDGRTGALRSCAGVGMLITQQGRATGAVVIWREELAGTFHRAAVISAMPSISGKKKIQV